MPSKSSEPQVPGKKDRLAQARETARVERERMEKGRRRRRLGAQIGVAVGVLLVAALVIAVIVFSTSRSATTAGPRNMLSGGIVFHSTGSDGTRAVATRGEKAGQDPISTKRSASSVQIVTYVDYQCPICQQFEQTNAAQISKLVASGAATWEIHPVAILDRASNGNRYSTRAANAAACVAQDQPDAFLPMTKALYANQPEEDGHGMSDQALTSIVRSAGADSSSVAKCITKETFAGWVTARTDAFVKGPIPDSNVTVFGETPTVVVNGQQYTGAVTDAAAFASFVTSVAASTDSTATPSN